MSETPPMTFQRRLASYARGRPYQFGTDLKLTPAQRRRLATKGSHARRARRRAEDDGPQQPRGPEPKGVITDETQQWELSADQVLAKADAPRRMRLGRR